MFELTIGGKVYKFRFGFGFMRAINKTVRQKENGVEKEVGMQMAIAGIIDCDAEDLLNVLDYANRTEEDRVTKEKLEAYIEDAETDVDALFGSVLDFLKKANVTKKKTMQLLKYVEEQKAKADQNQ